MTVVVIGREPLGVDDLAWLKAIPPALETRQLEIWNQVSRERRRKEARSGEGNHPDPVEIVSPEAA